MKYESLYSLYYKDSQIWEKVYQERFHSPFSRHLPLAIKQYHRRQSHPAFFCYTEEIALSLEKIASEVMDCHDILLHVPPAAISQFLHKSLVDEIKSTNDIEGVRSTRKEILMAFSVPASEQSAYRLGSIVNKYIKIIQREPIPLNTSQDIRYLFDDFLADEIRRDDPKNLPDGEIFRKDSVDIVSPTQKTIHQGVHPESTIIQMMDAALDVLNTEAIPYLIRIAVFHYFFGYIHPFYDGNGRMARFITSYLLAQRLHPAIALQVSILIKKYRKSYYDLFSHTDADINRGDLTPFIMGTLQFIEQATLFTHRTLKYKYQNYQKAQSQLLQTPDLPIKNKAAAAPLLKPFTPDHIVYCGPYPLFIENIDQAKEALDAFMTENDKEPRLILVQGVGAFIMEDDKGKAAKAQLLAKDAIKLAVYAESFGGPLQMTDEITYFITHWEAAAYRSKK